MDTGNSDEIEPARPTAEEYAGELGWNTSFDLDARDDSDFISNLRVLHYLEGLENITRKIGTAARTSIEESGTNMLFLVFGFLEWYEDDNSQQPRLAPLLPVPVTLERSIGRNGVFEATLEVLGDDPITNLSLAELVKKDFALEIPALEENDSPEEYFSRFTHILAQKPRWRIRRQITLTLLSFGKFLMYRDLDSGAHPGLCSHPILKDLFEGARREGIDRGEEYDIDAGLPDVLCQG